MEKEYQVKVSGRLDERAQDAFRQGIELKDFTAKPADLMILRTGDDGSEALVRLTEGKNRQVRRMFQALGHEVISLHRLAFGPLRLDNDLEAGSWRELTEKEIKNLKEAAGLE